jgi:outer membrane lipoprotein SlyB
MGHRAKKEVAMIGGGAVVGGVIGKVIDKKGSTELGAAAGAAAGTVLAAATGKQDIAHGAGTEVVFLSSRPTQIEVK